MALERTQRTISQQTGADTIQTQGQQSRKSTGKQSSARTQSGRRTGSQTQERTGSQTDASTQTSQATQAEASEQVDTALPYTQRQIQNPNRSRVISTDDIAINVQLTITYPIGMGTRPRATTVEG